MKQDSVRKQAALAVAQAQLTELRASEHGPAALQAGTPTPWSAHFERMLKRECNLPKPSICMTTLESGRLTELDGSPSHLKEPCSDIIQQHLGIKSHATKSLDMCLPFHTLLPAIQAEREARGAAEVRLATTKSALVAKAHLVSELRDKVWCCFLNHSS